MPENGTGEAIRLGIAGGGKRCRLLLEMFQSGQFRDFHGSVVAVADINPDAPGMVKAREMAIATTDYEGLLARSDIDLYVELTGERKVREEMERLLPPEMGRKLCAINRLFYDVLRIKTREMEEEKELEQTSRLLETIFDSIEEDILVVDRKYRIVDANDTAARHVGLSHAEIAGHPCYEITHRRLTPCEFPDHPCPMQEVLDTGRPSSATHEHFTREGKRYYEISHYPIKNNHGTVIMVLEIGRDISEVVNARVWKTEEKLKDDYSRLVMEDKLISLGKLMASVVHEINNPLSGTLNLAQLVAEKLKEGIPDEEAIKENLKYLDLMCSELHRSIKIVSGLRFFSRQEPKEERTVNVSETMERVLAIAHHKIRLQKINLLARYDSNVPDIRFQAGQLDQAFMNVVFNAIEAMPQGGNLSICISFDEEDGMVRVRITDTGCGIGKDDMLRIFEPFFSTKGEGKGVGLGLSVVHGIIKAHGGTIDYESVQGGGTTCTIQLRTVRHS